jgi:hypothetical protein
MLKKVAVKSEIRYQIDVLLMKSVVYPKTWAVPSPKVPS